MVLDARVHIYEDIHDDQLVKMLVFIIGILNEHTKTISTLRAQIDEMMSHFKHDAKSVQDRGRSRGGAERKRYAKQMTSRSKSSERLSRSGRQSRPSTPAQIERVEICMTHELPSTRYTPNPYVPAFKPPQQYHPFGYPQFQYQPPATDNRPTHQPSTQPNYNLHQDLPLPPE